VRYWRNGNEWFGKGIGYKGLKLKTPVGESPKPASTIAAPVSVAEAPPAFLYKNNAQTVPTLAKDKNRTPLGEPEPVIGNNGRAEDIALQNEASEIMAKQGFQVERLPNRRSYTAEERAAARENANRRAEQRQSQLVIPARNPDLKVEGRTFDVYAPRAETNPANIARNVIEKAKKGQADRVIVYLKRNETDPEKIREEIARREKVRPSTLQEVMGIDTKGDVVHIYP
jgi:hypothetical protein